MLENLTASTPTTNSTKKWHSFTPQGLRGLLAVTVFAWILEVIDLLLGGYLNSFGVHPRTISGLIGIPLMPFLHGDFSHLLSNTFPFLILGWIVLRAEKKNFIVASAVIIILGGAGTWLIGSINSVHIGASGLVYGYFGYVIIRAFIERNLKWILTGLAVGIFYGSMIWGIIPDYQKGISWEGHLCGMAAGIWFGYRRSIEMITLRNLPKKPYDPLDQFTNL